MNIKYEQEKAKAPKLSIVQAEYRISLTEDSLKDDTALRKSEESFRGYKQDQAERESKKNRKFPNEEPMIEYRPPFLNRLELDAFFQKYRIALEVQGAQHRLHSTSWYKDVKKLEDIVNRKKDAFVWNLDNGIFLIEVRYDQNPEIVIPERIRKIKEFVNQASKSFDLL
ncbi:hypothetical protein RhiirB3_531690 [Rhizophagus irregularis]|nr:hypothetical protein RhiirB3_531690 [Rhizophagus irregularis]